MRKTAVIWAGFAVCRLAIMVSVSFNDRYFAVVHSPDVSLSKPLSQAYNPQNSGDLTQQEKMTETGKKNPPQKDFVTNE